MKQTIVLLLLVSILFSCNKEEKGEILIKGTNSTKKNQKVYLIKARQSQGPSDYYNALDSTVVNEQGKYTFKTTIRGGDFYQLRDRNEYMLWVNDLYLRPGDSLKITETELSASDSVTEKINHFASRLKEKFPLAKTIHWIREKPGTFRNKIEKHYKKRQSFTREYFKDMQIDEKVMKRFLKENELKKINEKLDYLEQHNNYTYGQWYPLPLDSMTFEKPVMEVIKDTNWYFLNSYMQCVKKYTSAKYYSHFFNPLDGKSDTRALKTKKAIIDTLYEGFVKDIALGTLSADFWKYLLSMQDNFYETAKNIQKYFKQVKSRDQFFDLYRKTLSGYQRIKHGKPAPNFTLCDTSGQEVSLSDFQGNYVYITFWGTWLKPFVSDLDSYRSLLEEFKDNPDITMLFVALQPDNKNGVKAWKYFLNQYPFKGKHLIARGRLSNPEINSYLIKSPPAHVLVNPDGKIITPRAPGPEKAKKTIYNLFDQRVKISVAR